MIVINPSTRQFNIPGADLVFGVESDSGSVVKEFQCPRYVGNNLDLTACFIRMNYRNAQGEIDSKLIENVTVDGDNVVFGWELSPKVTMYKGNVSFVMCVTGPDTKVAWHTTLGRGQVLEGLEPDSAMIEEGTADVVAALIAMVEAQTEAVESKGAEWVRNVQLEGTDQISAVQTAGKNAESDAVAEIEAKGVNTRNSIPADYTALSEAVYTLNRTRGAAIVCSVEGSAITVNDASDMAIQGMKIFGRSTQDGTPTPDAPVEIKSVVEPVVTVAGKNLINVHRTDVGKTNATVVVNGEAIVVATASDDAFSRVNIPVEYPTNTPLTISFDATILQGYDFMTSKVMAVYMRKGSTNYGAINLSAKQEKCSYTVTIPNGIPETGYSLWLYIKTSAEFVGAVEVRFENIQIEVGSEATVYEPYKALQTLSTTHTLFGIPVTSGGNYTDSDGQQWICDEVDLERGVYVQRVGKIVFTGTEGGWYLNGSAANGDTRLFQLPYLSYSGTKEKLPKAFCTHVGRAENTFESDNTSFCVYNTGGKSYVRLRHNAADLDEFKSFLVAQHTAETPVTIYYDAGETIETTLSETEIAAYRALHSNYPNTTILNDAGAHMVVKYAADTKLYIDNKITALIGG